MARYRLPDVLGGGEIEANEYWPGCAGGCPGGSAEYRTATGITITMPEGMTLKQITAPTPEEPPFGSVVRADFRPSDHEDKESWVFERHGNGWYGVGRDKMHSWAQLCEFSTPVLLVPDRFEEVWNSDERRSELLNAYAHALAESWGFTKDLDEKDLAEWIKNQSKLDITIRQVNVFIDALKSFYVTTTKAL